MPTLVTKMHHLVIKPEPDSLPEYVRRINQHKSLMWTLAIRDLKIKYAQTILGLGWTIIQPLGSLLVYSLFFRYVLKLPSIDKSYEVQVFAGIIAWNLFSYIILQAGPSLQNQRELLTKLQFPKIILLMSKSLVGVIDALISFVLLYVLMMVMDYPISLSMLWLPPVLVVNIIAGLSVTFWISTLSLVKRDIMHLANFALRFGIWFTPVFYTLDMIPDAYQSFAYLNPMTTVVSLYRMLLIDGPGGPTSVGYYSILLLTIIGFLGLLRFKNMEDKYAELI